MKGSTERPMVPINVEDFIIRLLDVSTPPKPFAHLFTAEELTALCRAARRVFMSQPMMVEMEPPLKVCGDVHGQFQDVLRLFNTCGFPPSVNYLFLGDYVDRGNQSLELIVLFLSYKIKYPTTFYLLRGNHECAAVNRVYGFYEECYRRLQNQRIWLAFQDVFSAMPISGLVGGRILCMHGGLSPRLSSIDDLRSIARPCDPPNPSLAYDLLWADPAPGTTGWLPSTRGASFTFGPDVVIEMLEKLDIDLVARAHQVVQDGYEFFCNRRLVTIFSAPHYCGQYSNAAAVMVVDDNLQCSFQILRAHKTVKAMTPPK